MSLQLPCPFLLESLKSIICFFFKKHLFPTNLQMHLDENAPWAVVNLAWLREFPLLVIVCSLLEVVSVFAMKSEVCNCAYKYFLPVIGRDEQYE